MSGSDYPLSKAIENGELVIRIGLDTLAWAAEHCPRFYDDSKHADGPYVKVFNKDELAKDVARELFREKEDGSSPISDLLDEAIEAAFDDGSLAFDDG